jgi:hypothetical protein
VLQQGIFRPADSGRTEYALGEQLIAEARDQLVVERSRPRTMVLAEEGGRHKSRASN